MKGLAHNDELEEGEIPLSKVSKKSLEILDVKYRS